MDSSILTPLTYSTYESILRVYSCFSIINNMLPTGNLCIAMGPNSRAPSTNEMYMGIWPITLFNTPIGSRNMVYIPLYFNVLPLDYGKVFTFFILPLINFFVHRCLKTDIILTRANYNSTRINGFHNIFWECKIYSRCNVSLLPGSSMPS